MSNGAASIEALARLLITSETAPIPIRWSDAEIERHRDVARGIIAGPSPIDPPLAEAILCCVDGRFEDCSDRIAAVLRSESARIAADNECFISILVACHVAQQFRLMAALLRNRFDFHHALDIAAESCGPGEARIRWEITADAAHRFVFDACSYAYDKTRNDVLSFYWAFPLYAAFACSPYREHGAVIINQADLGSTPGLAWCENRPDYFLVPDCIFIPSRGYAHARETLKLNMVPWQDRAPTAFWRGATTGIPRISNDWRSLDRAQLCIVARQHEYLGVFDVGFSSIVQMPRAEMIDDIKASGFLRDPVPWEHWGRYKYLIQIDGNSNAWSSFIQRLLTGSPVLKVESARGFEQWFYDRLRPWENYVPVAPDLSDLLDKVMWLRRHDDLAQAVGQAGRLLALSMTYEREIERGIHTIASCFRYFRGDSGAVGPFGRPFTPEQ